MYPEFWQFVYDSNSFDLNLNPVSQRQTFSDFEISKLLTETKLPHFRAKNYSEAHRYFSFDFEKFCRKIGVTDLRVKLAFIRVIIPDYLSPRLERLKNQDFFEKYLANQDTNSVYWSISKFLFLTDPGRNGHFVRQKLPRQSPNESLLVYFEKLGKLLLFSGVEHSRVGNEILKFVFDNTGVLNFQRGHSQLVILELRGRFMKFLKQERSISVNALLASACEIDSIGCLRLRRGRRPGVWPGPTFRHCVDNE